LPTAPLVGGTIHIVEVARQLAQAYALDFYALAQPSAEAWPELNTLCRTVTIYTRTPSKGLSLDPPAARMEYSAPLLSALKRAWSRQPPAIVQIEFTTMMQYAALARRYGARVVCTAHNVAYLAQIRRARRECSLPLRARRWLGALSLWLYELRALRRCDLVITHNPEEAATLHRWLPSTRVEYMPSGVNLGEWPVCFDPAAEDEVLFVGSYQHPPNVEGALWLARNVWPLVRRECPNARLTLAGRAPPPEIQALAAPDIRVPGTLADLRPLYARASAFAAPIFWGGGVRIKLLEALAAGLPIVTTKLAAEGIDLQHERSALFAEEPEAFASAIARLMDDSALRIRLAAAGRALAERDYDWEAIGRRLIALYQQVGQ
jgi:glycosyltransferase involved in cell wall biosynthesis